MDKRFWGVLAVLAVIIGGIFWMTNDKKAVTTGSNSGAQPTQHIEGKSPTGVTLVEYGDYECPYCSEYYAVTKQLMQTYGDKITFQFRNLPLTQIHQNARSSARAAEAAGLQNKFWEMHDMLYTQQSNWANSTNVSTIFDGYAQQLGLNLTQFKSDYASEKVNNLINADVAEFNKTGEQQATPAYFLDGKPIQPEIKLDSFKQFIDAELAKKSGKPTPTVSPTPTPTASTIQQSKQ